MAEIPWLNADLTLVPGFEKNLPEDLREYAKESKDLPGLIKIGLDARREFRDRVRLPTDEPGKREFLTRHFKDVLDADAATARKTADEAEAKRKSDAEAAAKEAAGKQLAASQARAKTVLGGDDDKAVETNTELCRRAIRGEHMPQSLKEAIAKTVGVEWGKVSDDDIRKIIAADPMLAEFALSVAKLSQNGRTETADGRRDTEKEVRPGQPTCPELYRNKPDDDPEKRWFIKRGFNYRTMEWDGRPPQ
jgi:hypothetical protein